MSTQFVIAAGSGIGVKENIVAHSVTLSWTASTDTVDGYNIYRGTTAGGESTTALNTSPIAAMTFVDSTVPGPGDFFYTVKASAGGVLSAASNEVKASIVPAAPSGLTITAES